MFHSLKDHVCLLNPWANTRHTAWARLWNQGCAGFLVRSLAQHDMQALGLDGQLAIYPIENEVLQISKPPNKQSNYPR